jgi:hypothetical protein
MRCPECSQRNSVAAKACYSCGHKFKRKPLPISLKIAFAVTGLIIVAWGAIAAILPSFTDPKNALARIAKKVDEAVRNFLKQNGTQPPAQLSKTLQQALADSAFEVHVFELPRGLEVVEIDTILQASDYLILKTSSNIEVSAVPGMEVFDAAKIITEGAAPSLVMIGHTGGQGAHRPLIKVFALLPDHVIDQTAKSVPELKTEGTATFARNGRNVNIDYSVVAVGQGDKSFSPALKLPQGLSDETIHGSLKWVDGHYQPQLSGGGTGQISLLYAAARLLSGAPAAQYSKALGQIATDLATTGSDAVPQECTISLGQAPAAAPAPERRHHRSQPAAPSPTFYILQGKTLSCGLALDRSSGQWTIISAMKKPTQAQPALAQGTTDPNAMTATTTTATSTTPDGLVESKSPDDKIVTAKGSAPGMTEPTTSPTDVKSTSTATAATSSTKDTKSGAQTTASTSETVEQAKKVLDKISMVQSKGSATESEPPKKGADKTTEPDADKTASDTSKDKKGDKGKSESAVGISASVSDKIEVSAVRMRSGPGSRYAPITTIARGTKIKVIGKTSGWYKVRVNGKDGYVYGGFIDYKTPDAYETLTVEKAGQLTDDHSNKVYASKPGERLVVLGGSKDGKVRVQLSSGQTAYINKESVEKKDEKEETPQFVP